MEQSQSSWKWEKYVDVRTSHNTFAAARRGFIDVRHLSFLKHPRRTFGKQSVPRLSIGPAEASIVSSRQILCDFTCRDGLCASQHLSFGVFSVRIRMQSYHTLEGLSHSHRMAMNFKCGIKAFREAFTWGRRTQFLANWIFIYLFHKKGALATNCYQEEPFFCLFSAVASNKTTAGTNILSERNLSTVTNILFSVNQKIICQQKWAKLVSSASHQSW